MARPKLTNSLIVTAIEMLIDDTLRDRFTTRSTQLFSHIRTAVLTAQNFLGINPEMLAEALGDHVQILLADRYGYDLEEFNSRLLGTRELNIENDCADIWPIGPVDCWEDAVKRNANGYVIVDMAQTVSPIAFEFLVDCLNLPADLETECDTVPFKYRRHLMLKFVTEHDEVFGGFRDALNAFKAVIHDAEKLHGVLLGATYDGQVTSWKVLESDCSALIPYAIKAVQQQTGLTEDTTIDDLIACVREGDCG